MPIDLPDDYFAPRDPGFAVFVQPHADALADIHDTLLRDVGGFTGGEHDTIVRQLADVDAPADTVAADTARLADGAATTDTDSLLVNADGSDQQLDDAGTLQPVNPLEIGPGYSISPPQAPDLNAPIPPGEPGGGLVPKAAGPGVIESSSTGAAGAASSTTAAPGESASSSAGAPGASATGVATSAGEGAPASAATAAPAVDILPPAPQFVTVDTLRHVLDTLEATIVVMV